MFDLEQHIMRCWGVVDDVRALGKYIQDTRPMSEDELANYLLGLETIYQVKFEQLFEVFEDYIRQNK